MKTYMTIVGAALMLAAPAFAQAPKAAAPSATCKDLADAIEDGQRIVAAKQAEGLTDDSAPRATMRAAQQTAEYGRAKANLDLMAAHHCPIYPYPLGPARYLSAAVTCSLDLDAAPDKAKESCKRDQWKPGIH